MKLKRYNVKELYKNPEIKREFVCKGTVVCMAREGIEVPIQEVYAIYDLFTSKGVKMPDGWSFQE